MKTRAFGYFVGCLFAAMLLVSSAAFGQTVTGSITGLGNGPEWRRDRGRKCYC